MYSQSLEQNILNIFRIYFEVFHKETVCFIFKFLHAGIKSWDLRIFNKLPLYNYNKSASVKMCVIKTNTFLDL